MGPAQTQPPPLLPAQKGPSLGHPRSCLSMSLPCTTECELWSPPREQKRLVLSFRSDRGKLRMKPVSIKKNSHTQLPVVSGIPQPEGLSPTCLCV